MPVTEPHVSDILPFRATEATLANGLRVIVVPTGFPNLISLQIPVQTGSRNEVEPGKSGFAHFFEHMMFRGTKRFRPERYQSIVTRAGARQNAYTTDDYTNYHITFAKEDLEQILDIEADRFMHLEYLEADFRTEAQAILGEYNKSSADPLSKLLEVQRDHAYQVHPYKHTTMGFLADIEEMPNQFAYSHVFFERWYRPRYTTVILAGDLDPDEGVRLVEKYWGQWRAGGDITVEIPPEPAPRGPITAHLAWPVATIPWVSLGFHGPEFCASGPDYAALDILLDLFFGETSDVYQELVEREQLVDQLFVYAAGHQDPGLFSVFARVKDPADTPAVRDALLAAVGEARRAPVPAERLADAKSNARYTLARTLDNTESIAGTIARFVRYEREYGTLNELFRTYGGLAPEDLHKAALTYLTGERLVFTSLSHESLPAGLAESLEFPAPSSVQSSSSFGVVEQRTASPLLRWKFLFSVGSAHDPADRPGLAALSAAMIAEGGSSRMRIDEINRALYPIAGSFSARVDKEMTVFTAVSHCETADRFLDIVLPQLLAPGFREEDFLRLREQQRNALLQDLRSSNEEELGKEELQANLFAGTPYAHPVLGTASAIAATTLDDVRAFVAANYVQANLTLGATGDVSEGVAAKVGAALAKLPAGVAAVPPVVAPLALTRTSVEIVEKETRAVAISIGHPIAVTRAHPDFAALWLARSWIGEHRASNGQLFQRLREVRGMNYGDYAYIEAFPDGMSRFFPTPNLARRVQAFEIWIRPVRPEQAVFALKAALFELRSVIEKGLTAEQFEMTREYLSKNVFVMTKTQDDQLGYALDSHWYRTGEFVESMRAGLAALTVERVNAVIGAHLSGERLCVVMIAKDAAQLRDELLSERFTSMSYASERPAEVLAEDRVIGALELGLQPDDIRITPVDSVFA